MEMLTANYAAVEMEQALVDEDYDLLEEVIKMEQSGEALEDGLNLASSMSKFLNFESLDE